MLQFSVRLKNRSITSYMREKPFPSARLTQASTAEFHSSGGEKLICFHSEQAEKKIFDVLCNNNLFFSETSHPANQTVICHIILPASFSFPKGSKLIEANICCTQFTSNEQTCFQSRYLWGLLISVLLAVNNLFALHWCLLLCIKVVGPTWLAPVATC